MKSFQTLILVLISTAAIAQQAPEKVKWMSFDQAVKLSQKNPKKIMIDVYTDWCGWCKKMDAETFTNPVIAHYINTHFYAVKLNAEQRDSIVFQNHTYHYVSSGSRGYNELAAALLNNQLSFPSIAYMNEKMQLLGAVPGFRQPKDLEPLLVFIQEDKFLSMSYDKFLETFKGQIP